MGLLDIFYKEVNRWRDKSQSEKDEQGVVKRALRKSLTKFDFVWKDQILGGSYKREEQKQIFGVFSEEFMDLAVEVEDILKDEDITNNLREISRAFGNYSRNSTPGIGGYFENPIPKEIGEALNRINEINKKLKE